MTRKSLVSNSPVLLILLGPTASGKSSIAMELAKHLSIEIIGCDSMQVYRHMPLLTQAPTTRDRRRVPHHLTAFLDPSTNFSAARFVKDAVMLVRRIQNKGKIPCVVGGTGLYVTALLDGLFEGPGEDPRIRLRLARVAESKGTVFLHQRLTRVDPEAAKGIHPHDTRRVIRALEVIEKTGKRFSALKKQKKGLWDPNTVRIYGINRDRKALYARIEARVDRMFRRGLVAEVKRLKKRRLSRNAAVCLGFREVGEVLARQKTLDEAKGLLKQNTRRFAKRQLSWFRRDTRIRWIPVQEGDAASQVAGQILADFLSDTGGRTP